MCYWTGDLDHETGGRVALNKNKINDNALKFLQKGQIRKAIKEYDKILAEDPNDVRTLLKRGDLLLRVGEKAEAIDTYQKVAATYSKQGFHLKAVAVYKQILKTEPGRVDVNLQLAEEYQNLGISGDAMSHLQMVATNYEQNNMTRELMDILRRIVELDPANVPSRIKLAEMYSREGMITEAVEQFGRAAEDLKASNRIEDYLKVSERLIYHDSTNSQLIKEVANIYLQRGDIKRALGKLQICFKTDPHDLEVLEMLAQAFQGLNQISKTVSVFKEMAKIYEEQGSLPDTKKMYQRVLQLVPDDPEARAALSQQSEEPVDLEPEPVEEFDRGGQTMPTSSMSAYAAQTDTVSLDDNRNELDFADQEPEEVFIGDESSSEIMVTEPVSDAGDDVELTARATAPAAPPPDNELITRLLTETDVYVKYGLQNKAYEHLKKIFEMDPANIPAHQRLKDIYLQANQIDHAAQELLTLAYLHRQLGQDVEAAGLLRTLLSLVPGHPEATAALNELGAASAAIPVETEALEELEVGEPIEPEEPVLLEPEPEDESTRLADRGEIAQAMAAAPSSLDGPGPAALSIDEGEETVDVLSMPTGRAVVEDLLSAAEESVAQPEEELVEPEMIEAVDELEEEVPTAAPRSEPDLIPFETEDEFFRGTQTRERAAATSDLEIAAEDLAQVEEAPVGPIDISQSTTTEILQGTPPPLPLPKAAGAPAARPQPTEVIIEPPTEAEEAGAEQEAELAESLENIDFLVQQKLFDDAEEELAELEARYPDRPEIAQRKEQIASSRAEPEVAESEGEKFDLASEIDRQVGHQIDAALDDEFQYSIEDVFAEFKKGVEKVVDKSDSATHYDLGIAYKEMGLLEDAVNEFRVAAQDDTRYTAALTMVGLCYREMGQYSESVNRLKDALHGPKITDAESTAIYYELGQTYELLKDNGEAAFYYQKVYKRDPKFRDVAAKVNASGDKEAKQDANSKKNEGGSKPANSKSNISYM